jgi:hypothetical protein
MNGRLAAFGSKMVEDYHYGWQTTLMLKIILSLSFLSCILGLVKVKLDKV